MLFFAARREKRLKPEAEIGAVELEAVIAKSSSAGAPAGAPAGAQSRSESRPFELRSRLGNSGALVSLVPLDFKSSRQAGSVARPPTASTWHFVIVLLSL